MASPRPFKTYNHGNLDSAAITFAIHRVLLTAKTYRRIADWIAANSAPDVGCHVGVEQKITWVHLISISLIMAMLASYRAVKLDICLCSSHDKLWIKWWFLSCSLR